MLMVACTDHVEVMSAAADGKVLSTLDTGGGVDNLDYLPARRALYVAAGAAGTLTVAHLDDKGTLTLHTEQGTREWQVNGGLLEVHANHASVLADEVTG